MIIDAFCFYTVLMVVPVDAVVDFLVEHAWTRLMSIPPKSIRPTAVELSSDSCYIIVQQLSDDNSTAVGRLNFSILKISPFLFI